MEKEVSGKARKAPLTTTVEQVWERRELLVVLESSTRDTQGCRGFTRRERHDSSHQDTCKPL